ncbi:MAG: ABC transporter substrate-binding protein [Alphaproteobacteria bacterium]|jgi:phospholipid transport system substrate-binding protein|nr:ABC transporter substrate-binding protein [Alphaproteobacteria bacterium]MBT5390404.1 ABC transporter substrate-binding protein [Alphaproteobacteria bacterium]MBT5540624.1 ABC transporter substrate-binding protein [Alphaproteobacteria bacterium]MBT5653880.1 ABC transporter substrate-binding protein [Alphaproteobacteria bacterium]
MSIQRILWTGLFVFCVYAPDGQAAGPKAKEKEDITDVSVKFIQGLGDKATKLLTSPTITDEERDNRFKMLFKENFAVEGIGRFVLARYWKRATKEEKTEFLELFKEMVTDTYAARFGQYKQEKFEISKTRGKGDGGVLVMSNIIRSEGNKPITVHWLVYKLKGELKVFDVIVEGISLGVTQRSEYGAIIQRQGGKIEGLLAELRKKLGKK